MKLFVLFIIISAPTFAALNMRPGLWEIQTEIESGGKKFDPSSKMREAFAKMSPAQRKQMEAMMGKMGGSMAVTDKGMKVCYTKEMLGKEESIVKQESKCKMNFTSKTSTKVVSQFNCENGSTGTAVWEVIDQNNYKGMVQTKDKNGKEGKVNYKGKFLSSDCGSIKPRQG